MTDIEKLIAIEEIKHLKARNLRAMDEKRWDDYQMMFTEDHISDTYNGPPAIGPKANVERLKSVLEGIVTVHHGHMPEITFTGEDTADGIWAMEDMLFWEQEDGSHWLHGYGHYHEKYRKTAEGWKFCYRSLSRLHVRTSDGAQLGDLNRRQAKVG